MTMMPRATAYLVGEFDIVNEIPVLKNIAAMSEFSPRGGVFYALFLKAEGKDFEEATKNLYQSAASVPQWAWVLPWLERGLVAHSARMETIDYLYQQAGQMRQPRYAHDCTACRFLGRYNEYDLYYCGPNEAISHPSVLARYGSRGGEYNSMGLDQESQLPCLIESKRRALQFVDREIDRLESSVRSHLAGASR